MRFRKQKNNQNYEIITYKEDLENPAFCPVSATLRIIQRACRLGVPKEEPVAVYMSAKGRYVNTRCFITNSHIEQFLRNTARVVYKIPKDDERLKRWLAHSIRITACNLLHRQGLSDSYIQTRLRWRSKAFLDYLRNTLYTSEAHTKALRIPDSNLPRLTDTLEKVTLPSGNQVKQNSEKSIPVRRKRGPEELEQVLMARAA